MSAVVHNTRLRSAQLSYDNQSPPEGDDDRLEYLQTAIKRDPSFIGEAIGNADLTDLAAAHLSGDAQAVADAVADLVDAWLRSSVDSQLRRTDYFASDYPRGTLAATENVARLLGVAA